MATFDQDLDLRGLARLVNIMLQSATRDPELVATKESSIYFNSTEENIRLNVDGTNWYNTLLYKQASSSYTALPIISATKVGYVQPLTNSSTSKFVYLDDNGQPTLKQYVDLNWIDPDILTDKYTEITNGGIKIPNANAVYDFVTSAISISTGNYLPLAGGTMTGNITMSSTNKTIYNVVDNYISGSSTILSIVGKNGITFKIGTTDYLNLTSTALSPATTGGLNLGTSSYKYGIGYINTLYTNQIYATSGLNITALGSPVNISAGTKAVQLNLTAFIPYDAVTYPLNLGGSTAAERWATTYTNTLNTSSIVLSGATALTSVATVIDNDPTNAQIPTALAVWNLFNTIQPIDSTSELYGTVVASPISNPEDYFLIGDNTWDLKIWDVTGTTLSINPAKGITDFEFIAGTSVAFGVRANYTIQNYYDGSVCVYIGDIGPSLLTDFYYPIEIVSDLRTTNSILFGGTFSTIADVELQATTVSATPTLTLGTSLLQCGGVTTDGINIWTFAEATSGTIITDKLLVVTVNGTMYNVPARINT